MKYILLFLFTMLLPSRGIAQMVNILNSTQTEQEIKNIAVLADNNYTFNQIHTNKQLPFVIKDSLLHASVYWLRIIVLNRADTLRKFNLTVYPNFDNTLYYYNAESKKWLEHRSAMAVKTNPEILGTHLYSIYGLKIDTLYVKVNVNAPNVVSKAFPLNVTLTPTILVDEFNQNIRTSWIVGMVILVLFFLNNLYVFFSFRDRTVLYYLIIQLGGMIYITSYWHFFSLWYNGVFSQILFLRFDYYNVNRFLAHVAIVFIFGGFAMLYRSYLNTKINLPLQDRLIKIIFCAYIVLSIIIATVNLSGFYLDHYTAFYDNIYCVVMVGILVYTSVVAYIKKLPAAGSFLIANIFPLIFGAGIPLYHLFVSPTGVHNYWFSVLAITSQAFGFSLALVTRTKNIQNSLVATENQRQQLQYNLMEVESLNKQNEQAILDITADIASAKQKNELLEDKIEAHQRELTSSTLYLAQKNELLTNLKGQVKELKSGSRYQVAKNLEEMTSLLENNIQLDTDWGKFKMHFEQVHPDFFENLISQHPTLTQKEIRLYAYFHMKLSHKEIAALLNIDPASVRRAKTRLLKKMVITKID